MDVTSGPVPARYIHCWGERGTEPGQFNIPIDIALDRDDNVFVTDFYNGRVQKFSSSGKLLAVYPTPPQPGGIAVDGNGDLYVTHFGVWSNGVLQEPDSVSVHAGNGTLLHQWGSTGREPGQLFYPGGIAIGSHGRLYIADQTNRRVQVFEKDGTWVRSWGEYGLQPGQFGGNVSPDSRVGGPQFVAIDKLGRVCTTEGTVGRIQKFTSDGRFLLSWGDNEDLPGSFGGKFAAMQIELQGPIGIVADPQGNIWVSAVSGRVQQFSPEGTFLRELGTGQGTAPGQFLAPHGMAFDSRGFLYIVDTFNHRVQKFMV